MAARRLEFRILGPLALRVDGVPVPAGGPKQRALLALLLLDANRVVSRDRLVAELFPDQSVNSADHALRNHVSRLRKVLGTAVVDEPRLVARPPGYLLRVEPGELDLEAFERLVVEGHESLGAGDSAAAADSFRAAEALWHGRPLADLELEPFARLDVERLEELRLAAVEARIDAELALGRQRALVPELEALTEEHPLRERFRAQLMLALYRSGRQAESLDVYRRTHRLLGEELGLHPGTELQELERAILVQDPVLDVAGDGGRSDARSARTPICPFKGLAPFEPADAEYFFGRERLVDELSGQLAGLSFLAIVGASGSGKSSLLRAGLLPSLGATRAPVIVRPGDRPLAALTSALQRPPAQILDEVPVGQRVVIGVDQFEEVFGAAVSDEERRGFIRELVEAAWDPDRRAVVVIAVRADFFERLAAHPELADLAAANQVLLGRMTASELRRAIEGPAERVGLAVEPGLVDALLDDVGGEAGGLPLLSTALVDLWLDRDETTLTLASYERSGGVRTAIARHAESVFASFDEHGRATARRLLVRLASGGDGEALTRRRVRRSEVDADDEPVAGVLAALVESRLVVAHDDSIELVHEALLEHWPRLVGWLDEDAQGRRLQQRLSDTAREWEAGGRDRGELLRGARLGATLEWVDSAGAGAALNRVERDFLEQSRAGAAEESSRQRRANRRLRVALLATLAVLVLAAVAGALALGQRADARRQATAADAQRLGAQALAEPALDRSLLLAREGAKLDDSLATRSNLLAALLRSQAAIGMVREGSRRLIDEALSPDGRVLAVRGDDGGIAFFATRTLRRIGRDLPGSDQLGAMGATPGPFHALAFSPDGMMLAVGSTTGSNATLDLVDRRTKVPRVSKSDADEVIVDVAFSPDGRRVATGEPVGGRISPPSQVVVVRDTRSGKTLASSAEIPGGRVIGFVDGERDVLVTSGDRSLLLNSDTLQVDRVLPGSGAAAVDAARDVVAFGRQDGSVALLDLRTGRRRALAGRVAAPITVASFAPRGTTLATGEENGDVTLWDVRTGAVRATMSAHTGSVRGAVFSPDGGTLYTASYDGSVIAWDVTGTRSLVRPFRFTKADGLSTWADATRGGLFALSPGPDRVALWRLPAHELRPELRAPIGGVRGVALSRDGKLAAAVGDREGVLWDVRSRHILREVPVGEHGANGVAISSDDHTWAIGEEDDAAILLFDVRTGKRLGDVTGGGSIQDVDFSPDGKLLASADLTGIVHVFDVATQTEISQFRAGTLSLSVRFSPDGRLVAVGDLSDSVVFFDPRTGGRVGQPLVGGGGALNSLDFDPTGRTLLTGSQDGKLRLWDLATRKLIGGPLPGASSSNTSSSAAFFPDGKHVLGVFQTGEAVIWNVDPAAWTAAACRIANRQLTHAEWQTFLPTRAYRRVCP